MIIFQRKIETCSYLSSTGSNGNHDATHLLISYQAPFSDPSSDRVTRPWNISSLLYWHGRMLHHSFRKIPPNHDNSARAAKYRRGSGRLTITWALWIPPVIQGIRCILTGTPPDPGCICDLVSPPCSVDSSLAIAKPLLMKNL